jgi:hypothetical protein
VPSLTGNRYLGALLSRWNIGALETLQSGPPFTVLTTANTTNAFPAGALRPDLVGAPELAASDRTLSRWFNTSAFAQPAANKFGNAPRSVVRGPGTNLTDLAIFKNFKVGSPVGVQYRLEMFNAFNHTQFGAPGTTMGLPTFGRLTSAGDPRLIQMGFKVTF